MCRTNTEDTMTQDTNNHGSHIEEVTRMYRRCEIRSNGNTWEVWYNGRKYYSGSTFDGCTDFIDECGYDIRHAAENAEAYARHEAWAAGIIE